MAFLGAIHNAAHTYPVPVSVFSCCLLRLLPPLPAPAPAPLSSRLLSPSFVVLEESPPGSSPDLLLPAPFSPFQALTCQGSLGRLLSHGSTKPQEPMEKGSTSRVLRREGSPPPPLPHQGAFLPLHLFHRADPCKNLVSQARAKDFSRWLRLVPVTPESPQGSCHPLPPLVHCRPLPPPVHRHSWLPEYLEKTSSQPPNQLSAPPVVLLSPLLLLYQALFQPLYLLLHCGQVSQKQRKSDDPPMVEE